MTETLPTDTAGRAVSAAEADHSLAVLTRHALTVRSGTAPAPTSVTVANGPVLLRISWEDRLASGAAASVADASSSPADASGAVAPGAAATGSDTTVPTQENGLDAGTFTLAAETVGVFYRAPEPGAAPFVTDGDPVRAGQQVGIVEAMKLMIPVTAARDGRVAEFLVGDAEPVEYGQPLIRFEEVR
ncbi:acetyl-CoA carboxylase biotin carboxyl carrier protein [Nocardia otitidiscaviarum]|uniref:Biotin carboxyl carrier protein of acetyl-CoA carboxylase n=1 Tax=Nocardia otitidiscaviarum TaxID=1823 RepID=A0A516NHV2_9NOCA|nr:acetyl-CoA carboxylase biotin carboxyl carrier protein subunit [Nocardia otitidiscaviarum]MBF6177410.1 acetyl-CoA carboxylase biotin carboxyl carrier protein subunit [Nocardia otitidiscaviarum]MCP9618696.1 hypothetical protein [Nocardia otitidiscaviarum]QDP78482.1 acetyl-CoA carboxylase biotin carboxyl carrier protein subunit [Nocardia otitidiscaviarum]